MIYIEPEHKLSITFTNTTESNDITTFVNIIKKCAKESSKAGFKGMFNKEEKSIIFALNENLNSETKVENNYTSISSNLIKIED